VAECTSLLYFVVRVRCRRTESSRSLSHLLISFLFQHGRYPVHNPCSRLTFLTPVLQRLPGLFVARWALVSAVSYDPLTHSRQKAGDRSAKVANEILQTTDRHRAVHSCNWRCGKCRFCWIRPALRPTHSRHADCSYITVRWGSPASPSHRVCHWHQICDQHCQL